MSIRHTLESWLPWRWRRAREAELERELRDHLDLGAEEQQDAGLSSEDASYAARRALGNIALIKEDVRTAWGFQWLETLLQDLRYGLRQLCRNPGFTIVAVLTLALGIGVNTTIFSMVSAILLRKPPISDPGRVVMLCSRNPAGTFEADLSPASPLGFMDWRAQSTSFSAMAASTGFDHFTLGGGTEPARISGVRVTANYFDVLGVEPILGRTFMTDEGRTGHDRVVILSEGLWKRRLGGDPHLLGRTVKVDGDEYTVIGIMPSGFRLGLLPAQVWMPLVFTPEQLSPPGRKEHFLEVFARLKPGVSERQARTEFAALGQRIAGEHPDTEKGWGANLLTAQEYNIRQANATTPMIFLMAAVSFVLLIACANLANLILARNSARRREFTVRASLGASRLRMARQLLSECFLLAVAGGALGLLFTYWGVHLIRAAVNWNEYADAMASGIYIDDRVLIFTLALSVLSSLIFGIAPAIQISRSDLNSGLKESSRAASGGHERHRLQNFLVVGQLAVSLILLVGAGLFVKSLVEETQAAPGMNPQGLLTAAVPLSGDAYKTPRAQLAFHQKVLRQLASFSQVQSAAVTSDLPYTFPASANFDIERQAIAKPEERPSAGYFSVSPAYFGVTQIPLLRGREFRDSDNRDSAPVAIVNEAFSQKFLPNKNPLEQRIRIIRADSSGPEWSEIVGVVGNVNEYLGQTAPRPQIFVPFLQRPEESMSLVVRLRVDPSSFANSLRRAVWSVDQDQPLTDLRTMNRVVSDAGQGDDVMAELMGVFAGLALVMAAIGIYGLLAYLVAQRTREIGIRMALGAQRIEVFGLILRKTMSLTLTGVAIGFLISLALPGLFKASFVGFHVHSGWILAGTPLAVVVVALLSCYVPARRAAEVDPKVALRYE